MDLRVQRWLLVGLFFIVTIVLFRNFSGDGALRRARFSAKSNAGKLEDPDELDVKGLRPANATLGVSISRSSQILRTRADARSCSSEP